MRKAEVDLLAAWLPRLDGVSFAWVETAADGELEMDRTLRFSADQLRAIHERDEAVLQDLAQRNRAAVASTLRGRVDRYQQVTDRPEFSFLALRYQRMLQAVE